MSRRYTIKELYGMGLISASVLNYKEINDKIKQLKSAGMSNGEAVRHVSVQLRCTIQTVYNAQKLKQFF